MPGAGVQYRARNGDDPQVAPHLLGGFERIELTGADGTFTMAVPPGKGYLFVQGPTPDYVHEELDGNQLFEGRPGGSRLYPDAAVPLDVRAKAEPKPVAVTLRRGATVRGRLVGQDGRPVPRAVLLCRLHV